VSGTTWHLLWSGYKSSNTGNTDIVTDPLQLLRELMQVCPELASPLGRIRDALGQALYSNYYAASDGTLELKQLPFFTVVQRLELEKTNLQQKYEDSKTITAAQEVRGAQLHSQSTAPQQHCLQVHCLFLT